MVNDGGAPDKRFLESIFKTDLHCHLGGSIRLKTLVELADEQSVPLPSKDIGKLKKTISPSEFRSLEEYLAAFTTTESVLRDPAALERVAYEVCEDAAKENVIYLELRFGPTNYETDDLSPQRVVSSVLDGMKRAEKDYSIKTGLILCGIRTELERTREAAELAVIFQGRGVVGFDLAGAERGHRPKDLMEAFAPVLKNFVPVTVHAGEGYGAKSIEEAINYLRADRIGHGTKIQENTKLYDYVNVRRIALEVCPTSNVQTRVVSSIGTHPMLRYFRDDLRVCINTDNRTISDTTVTNELFKCSKHLGLSRGDIKSLVKAGVKAAFLQPRERTALLDRVDEQFEEL